MANDTSESLVSEDEGVEAAAAADETSRAPTPPQTQLSTESGGDLIENRTMRMLSIKTNHGRAYVPPLGRGLVEGVAPGDLDAARAAGVIALGEESRPDPPGDEWIVYPIIGAAVCVIWAVGAERLAARVALGAAAGVLALIAVFVVLARLGRLSRVAAAGLRLPRRMMETANLVAVFALVLVIPGAILYFGSDVRELYEAAADGAHDAEVALIGVGVQGLCIAGASALPVLLYFVFDREKLRTLRGKFIRHIFRLDPSMRTLTDVEAKYGELLDEVYGRQADNRLLPGRRSPILVATAVMSLGWTIALVDTDAAALDAPSLTSLLEPTPTAPTYAFLGAYFFALNQVLRGYVRGDLRPKTYANIATRIVGAVVLAFVLQRLVSGLGGDPGSAVLLTLAFLGGVVPETVLVRLQEAGRARASRQARRDLSRLAPTYEREPLTELQGIDLYDRARLADEGVTNVEGLAHHDLVELLLKTRIPPSRLVDWVDQAILYIHCEKDAADADEGRSVRMLLRGHGIRTATELERAFEAAATEDEFLAIVPSGKGPPVLRTVLDAIAGEPWMESLRHWHEQPATAPVLRVPEDSIESMFDERRVSRAQAASRSRPDQANAAPGQDGHTAAPEDVVLDPATAGS